jgi:hypothetical protein
MRLFVSLAAAGLLVALAGCFVEVKRSGGGDKASDPAPVAAPEPEGDPRVAPMPREVTRPRAPEGNTSGPPAPPEPEVAPPPRAGQ